ncbi:MAG: hypothetical protein OEV31_07925, partial [Gammaproteobacteria bacterium]|nr:hypothetical protein [Gammaproteobacteria bacterium]
AAAQADKALYLKGGTVQILDDSQTFNGVGRALDEKSTDTYGLLFEHRTRRDMAFGVEYLNFTNDFTPAGLGGGSPGNGFATTRTLNFVAKKYLGKGVFHPFFGLGVGLGRTTVDYADSSWADEDIGISMQVMAGLELRFQEMGLMFEAKRLNFDMSSSNSTYNPSAVGFFASIGFNW